MNKYIVVLLIAALTIGASFFMMPQVQTAAAGMFSKGAFAIFEQYKQMTDTPQKLGNVQVTQRWSENMTILAGETDSVIAYCERGEIPIAGGFMEIGADKIGGDLPILGETGVKSGWLVQAKAGNYLDADIRATVLCAKVTP